MKNLLFLVLMCLSFVACEKQDDTSNERRGGNGNNQAPYTQIYTAPTDWNVTFDTSACGIFELNWDAQPGAVTYYVNVIGRPWNCAGSPVNTNQWYFTYGYGCSMIIGHTYDIQLSYFIKDDVNRITTHYYSDTATVRTGSRGLWNCN